MTLWCEQIKCDLYQLGLEEYWRQPQSIVDIGQSMWREVVKKAIRAKEAARWRREMNERPILRTYRTIMRSNRMQLQAYLTIPHGGWNDRIRIGRKVLTRLRCGVNELRIHTGRFDGLEVDQRVCRLCADGIEDERHFLLTCEQYQDGRVQLWQTIDRLVSEYRDSIVEDDAQPSPTKRCRQYR